MATWTVRNGKARIALNEGTADEARVTLALPEGHKGIGLGLEEVTALLEGATGAVKVRSRTQRAGTVKDSSGKIVSSKVRWSASGDANGQDLADELRKSLGIEKPTSNGRKGRNASNATNASNGTADAATGQGATANGTATK